ncbi:hypothetical protein [Streptomyces sp. NPDC093598]
MLGTLPLVPLGTGRALLDIAVAVLLLVVAGMIAPLRPVPAEHGT